MFTGSGEGVGNRNAVGGRMATDVGRCAICVGTGSEVTVTGVGASSLESSVRVGRTVLVGTLVRSSCCCGALVRLQAAAIRTNNTNSRDREIKALPQSGQPIAVTFLVSNSAHVSPILPSLGFEEPDGQGTLPQSLWYLWPK